MFSDQDSGSGFCHHQRNFLGREIDITVLCGSFVHKSSTGCQAAQFASPARLLALHAFTDSRLEGHSCEALYV
ncbi:unnamed protein product [Urochloa humidicola]